MNEYLSRFLKLRCCGDILNIVCPVSSGIEKEISEAFSIITNVKPIVLGEKDKYKILDLCCGNPLGSILSAFLLPIKEVIAVDKKEVKRNYELIRKFQYIEGDIYNDSIFDLIDEDTIIMAIHPCRELAKRIIEIYNESKANYLFLMPCCEGDYSKLKNSRFLAENLSGVDHPLEKTSGNYLTWVYYLSTLCDCRIVIDKKCASPKNAIIIGKKSREVKRKNES